MNQKPMKKSLITLAVLGAFAGAAQAQAPATVVTLYGSFDGGLRNQSSGGQSRLTMNSGGTYNSNRLGFKGTEDIGGGNNAHFALEIGFLTGTGALDNASNQLFNRTAAVGMGGSWGSVDFGRQYSVAFKVIGGYDPFNYKYTGIIPLAGASIGSQVLGTPTATTIAPGIGGNTRFNNDIQYAGGFGPLTVRAEYALGEQNGSRTNGTAEAVGVTWTSGPISVGGAYSEQKPNLGTTSATGQLWRYRKQATIGGAFTAGPFRAAVGFIDDKLNVGNLLFVSGTTSTAVNFGELRVRNAWGGLSFSVSPKVAVTGAVYQTKQTVSPSFSGINVGAESKRDLVIVGVTYAFSKRTNLYADYDHAKTKAKGSVSFAGAPSASVTAAADVKVKGISVGINHTF